MTLYLVSVDTLFKYSNTEPETILSWTIKEVDMLQAANYMVSICIF